MWIGDAKSKLARLDAAGISDDCPLWIKSFEFLDFGFKSDDSIVQQPDILMAENYMATTRSIQKKIEAAIPVEIISDTVIEVEKLGIR